MSQTTNTVEIHRCDECGATWKSDGHHNNIEWGRFHTAGYGPWKGLKIGADFCSPECLRDNVDRAIREKGSA